MTLEQYFHKIVNKPVIKESTMFDIFLTTKEALKAKFTELWTKPVAFVEEGQEEEAEDFWCFLARTSAYDDIEAKETFISGAQDGTWMEIVDQVLDVLGKHYGYNIKEQVYYSVTFPLNHPESSSYGRELNDEVLQKLLLSFPEVYETGRIE